MLAFIFIFIRSTSSSEMLTKKNEPKKLKLRLIVGPSMCFEWDKNMLEEGGGCSQHLAGRVDAVKVHQWPKTALRDITNLHNCGEGSKQKKSVTFLIPVRFSWQSGESSSSRRLLEEFWIVFNSPTALSHVFALADKHLHISLSADWHQGSVWFCYLSERPLEPFETQSSHRLRQHTIRVAWDPGWLIPGHT